MTTAKFDAWAELAAIENAECEGASAKVAKVAPLNVPAGWADGVARLITLPPPTMVHHPRWQLAVKDARRFLRDWAGQASALGWTTLDVFGAHPTHPVERVDRAGLVILLHGDEVVAITRDSACTRTRAGATLSYCRRPHPLMARARGLAPWQPRAKSLALLGQVNAVLDEYREHLPLTIRQIFYRLVGVHAYDKTEQAYDRLGEMLNRARRAGLVRFDAIRDDGVDMRAPSAWDDAEHLVTAIRNTITNFRLDRQQGQPRRLLFAVEAAGMLPQIERIAGSYGIPVQSSGGFDSLTAKYGLAGFLGGSLAAEVLHIGDHDPSGVHVFSSLAEDVHAICGDRGYEVDVTFTRLAVTPAQIAMLGLPTAPPKATDKRSFDGEATVQAEAIPPDVLADIVQQAIDDRMDQAAWRQVRVAEERAKTDLLGRFAGI